jgi:hypothetical protein
LITQVATSPDMANAVDVPAEFTGGALTVPNIPRSAANGNTGTLYFRLRDDPDTVQTLNLPITVAAPGSASTDAATSVTTSPGGGPDSAAQQPQPDASKPALPAAKTDSASTPSATPGPNL